MIVAGAVLFVVVMGHVSRKLIANQKHQPEKNNENDQPNNINN